MMGVACCAQARALDNAKRHGGAYPFGELTFHLGHTAVLLDMLKPGVQRWGDWPKNVQGRVKDTYKLLPTEMPHDIAYVVLIDELKARWREEYEAGQLQDFVEAMNKKTMSLPWPSLRDPVWNRVAKHHQGEWLPRGHCPPLHPPRRAPDQPDQRARARAA
jgi:hypothetical protein